jgi:hypothetical protein
MSNTRNNNKSSKSNQDKTVQKSTSNRMPKSTSGKNNPNITNESSDKKVQAKVQAKEPAILCLTMDRQPEDAKEIYEDMTVSVSKKMKSKNKTLIQARITNTAKPSYTTMQWLNNLDKASEKIEKIEKQSPDKVDEKQPLKANETQTTGIKYADLKWCNSKTIEKLFDNSIELVELNIFAHGAYFAKKKYENYLEGVSNSIEAGINKKEWAGQAAGHVRKSDDETHTPQKDRHIGEYRLDEVADLIAQILVKHPKIHMVKFYVCETGQTYQFPRNISFLIEAKKDSLNQDFVAKSLDEQMVKSAFEQNTKRKKKEFKRTITRINNDGVPGLRDTYNQFQKDINDNRTGFDRILDLYYKGKYEGRTLSQVERDEYLAEYTNAEIILALVDVKLQEMEKREQLSTNPCIIFKAPTGLMDVRKGDPKYRAFDRVDYDKVAEDNDNTIADNRDVVPGLRLVLWRK